MFSMLLILAISLGNLALGFFLAVFLGRGPLWAEKLLPRPRRK